MSHLNFQIQVHSFLARNNFRFHPFLKNYQKWLDGVHFISILRFWAIFLGQKKTSKFWFCSLEFTNNSISLKVAKKWLDGAYVYICSIFQFWAIFLRQKVVKCPNSFRKQLSIFCCLPHYTRFISKLRLFWPNFQTQWNKTCSSICRMPITLF